MFIIIDQASGATCDYMRCGFSYCRTSRIC